MNIICDECDGRGGGSVFIPRSCSYTTGLNKKCPKCQGLGSVEFDANTAREIASSVRDSKNKNVVDKFITSIDTKIIEYANRGFFDINIEVPPIFNSDNYARAELEKKIKELQGMRNPYTVRYYGRDYENSILEIRWR